MGIISKFFRRITGRTQESGTSAHAQRRVKPGVSTQRTPASSRRRENSYSSETTDFLPTQPFHSTTVNPGSGFGRAMAVDCDTNTARDTGGSWGSSSSDSCDGGDGGGGGGD